MPRRHRHRTMKGGFLESLSQGASDLWEKTKKASSDAYSSVTGSTTSSSTYVPPPSSTPPPATSSSGYMGGRKRSRKNRKIRGGVNPTSVLSDDKDSKQVLEESQMKYTSMPPSQNLQMMEKINKEMAIARAADDAAIEAMSKGGKKMRGGYSDNIALTGLAARAAPISDIKSAQPLNIVGGRRTKRRYGGKHGHSKSCKHRRR